MTAAPLDARIHRSGAGAPLLFLHGLGSDASDIQRDLAGIDGFELITPDQRNHGGSRPYVGRDEFTLDRLVDDLDTLLTSLDLPEPVVGGGSMGSAVALRWAIRGGAARALVLVAPAVSDRLPPGIGIVSTYADRVESLGQEEAVRLTRADLLAAGLTQPQAADALAPWLRQDSDALIEAMRAIMGWRVFSSWSELERVRMPVAVVGVEQDLLHPADLARDLAAALPNAALRVIESPLAMQEPGRLSGELLSALRELDL